jgi:large subunit ribosomal protein L14
MKGVASNVTGALQVGSQVPTCDNSGAKVVEIISVRNKKTTKGRRQVAGVGDMVIITVKKGRPDVRKQVMHAIVVRQKKEFKRPDGMRIKFEDNAIVVCKDEKGNPKGTIFKGPIAKEAADRWPAVANVASIIV